MNGNPSVSGFEHISAASVPELLEKWQEFVDKHPDRHSIQGRFFRYNDEKSCWMVRLEWFS